MSNDIFRKLSIFINSSLLSWEDNNDNEMKYRKWDAYLEDLNDHIYTRSSCSDFEIKKRFCKVMYDRFRIL
jgi:hypothetical protein